MKKQDGVAYFHLPGLFEFYELYKAFLPLFHEHREYFYDWCDIGSIYGAPADCIWGGGRVEDGDCNAGEVLSLVNKYGISARLTFSNSLLREEHLADRRCNELCRMFCREQDRDKEIYNTGDLNRSGNDGCGYEKAKGLEQRGNDGCKGFAQKDDDGRGYGRVRNGVIVHSELLLDYLKASYPELYLVSSTTKVLTDFDDLVKELDRKDFSYVVPDFRLNKRFDRLENLSEQQKNKVEFLCNECCYFGCTDRRACYEDVSRRILGEAEKDYDSTGSEPRQTEAEQALSDEAEDEKHEHECTAPDHDGGYRFSKAMLNPGFIGIDDIRNIYIPMGFMNFKIEGRGLGSALILEFLLYYMTKPEFRINVREEIYLDNTLDLF